MGYYIPKEPGRPTRREGHLMRGFVPKPIKGCQSLVFMGMGRLLPSVCSHMLSGVQASVQAPPQQRTQLSHSRIS
jgi:hypothetical protein